jgi:hypothetical protein
MLIKYDNINKKYPYFKFYVDDENFVFDTNFLLIDENPNNQHNKKVFFVLNNDTKNVVSYMYYYNGWNFRKSLKDFGDINDVSSVSLFIPEFNILSLSISIIRNTRFYLGDFITPPVVMNSNRFFIGELI